MGLNLLTQKNRDQNAHPFRTFLLLMAAGMTSLGATFIPHSEFSYTRLNAMNVVVIVLDEAPLFPLLKTDGTINASRFPGFAALATSSTWYRNTLGTAQRTTEAVPAILDGRWPTFKNYPYLKDHPNNLFTLLKDHRALDVYQSITHLCPPKICPNAPPAGEKTLENQVKQLRRTIKNAATSKEPTLHFSHVLLPHRPWGLVPDLRQIPQIQRKADPRPISDPERRQDNYQSFLRQFVATDTLIEEFVTAMKESKKWDDSLVIVTADHGITFVPGETYRDKINIQRPETLEDIYRIPLFVKYPKQKSARVSDCPSSSIDILQTIIGVMNIKPKWKTEGTDLSRSCPTRSSRVVRWPKGQISMSTDFSSVLKRVSFYNSWINANGDVDDIYRVGQSGKLLGQDVPSIAVQRQGMRWDLNSPEKFQRIGTGEFAEIVGGASGKLFTEQNICRKCEGLIAFNGKFVGVITELAGVKPSKNGKYFSSPLMTRLMTPGPATVEMWIANWTKATPVFTRVGAPRNTPKITP